MQDELSIKKRLYFAIVYGNNAVYLLFLTVIATNVVFDKDLLLTILISGVPAIITILVSTFVVGRNKDKLSIQQLIIRLGIIHIISILGLIAALLYLFIV